MDAKTVAVAGLLLAGLASPSHALNDLAERCEEALQSGDRIAFEEVVTALRPRKDVFATAARKRVEKCLSEGFGEPWAYSFPDSAWLSVSEAEARMTARQEANLAQERAKDYDEAQRKANVERVWMMVYASCSTLLERDQVAAMTNALCVNSFLENGLP